MKGKSRQRIMIFGLFLALLILFSGCGEPYNTQNNKTGLVYERQLESEPLADLILSHFR